MTTERQYPDSVTGVRRLLHDDSDFTPAQLAGATITPDPHIAGAWLVTLTGGDRLLAYVGGHALAPAFEEVDP